MKLLLPSNRREEAAVLIASLFIGGVLGLVLGSYLLVIRTQYVASARSQAWRSALDMAEAGAEEALAHLNSGAGYQPSGNLQIVARAGDHWTGPNNGLYGPVTRTLNHGSYTVAITEDPNPIIYSTGYVTSTSGNLSRAVQLTTASAPLTRAAVASQGDITMTGTGKTIVFSDSFDSAHPSSGTRSNGDIVSLSGKLSIGTNIVKGDVFLGPTATGSGQVRGNTSHDLSVDFPDVIIPSKSWLTPSISNSNINGTTYRYVFGSGTKTDFQLTTSGAIYIRGAAGNINLLIASDTFDAPAIHVENSSTAKLTIFLPGSSFKLSGSAVVDGGDPSKLTILGTPSTRSISFTNQASFTGTIYAPSADFTNYVSTNPRATNVVDFRGALVANSVTVKGLCSFHFDENLLKNTTLSAGYFVTSWREL